MEHSFRLLLWLYKSKVNKKGLAPLFLRVTIDGQKAEISTGVSLPLKLWDAKKGLIKGHGDEAKELNKKVAILKGKVIKVYNELSEADTPISAEQLKRKLIDKGQDAKTLLQAFDYHNRLLERKIGIEVTKATLTKYETLKKKVTSFITDSLKRKDVFLRELNHQFVVEFEIYLKSVHRLSHNPAIKYIQFLKKIIHLSIANGWLLSDPFKNFKCTLISEDRGYLTMNELERIMAKAITIQRIGVVRDMFVFSCFTGLSYSDMKKLCCRHIETKEDGKKWIILNRTKTGVRSAIPLLPQAIKILDKYEPPFIPDKDSPILPIVSNQKMNAYLKELADICGVETRLTFHLARHTFATTITLTNGVPIETVSKMLGHTNLKTTQVYSKVVDTKIANDMLTLATKLTNNEGKTMSHQ